MAGATQERKLLGVGSSAWLGRTFVDDQDLWLGYQVRVACYQVKGLA
jgi:hypothetical protein